MTVWTLVTFELLFALLHIELTCCIEFTLLLEDDLIAPELTLASGSLTFIEYFYHVPQH